MWAGTVAKFKGCTIADKNRAFAGSEFGEVFKGVAEDSGLCLCSSIDEMAAVLKKNLKKGDTLLLKASRGVAIERVIGLLFNP